MMLVLMVLWLLVSKVKKYMFRKIGEAVSTRICPHSRYHYIYVCASSIDILEPGEYEKDKTNRCYMINDEILEQGKVSEFEFYCSIVSCFGEGL